MAWWTTGQIIIFIYLCAISFAMTATKQASHKFKSHKLKDEIESLRDDANKIIDFLTKGPGKHQVYKRLATFVDTFGSRIAGSTNLEHAIDYMLEELQQDQLDNVHGEEVNVTHWVRGKESAQMILPRKYPIALLGLGGSVGTTPDGITAEVLVVQSFDELHEKAAEVFSSRGGGGAPHMKVVVGMLIVSLRGVNFGFWFHLGCSGQNAIIFSCEGLV